MCVKEKETKRERQCVWKRGRQREKDSVLERWERECKKVCAKEEERVEESEWESKREGEGDEE